MRRPALLALLSCSLVVPAVAPAAGPPPGTREVMFVGNNWDGTADVVDMHTYAKLAHINVIPDIAERRMEILSNPVDAGFFVGVRVLIGEGHDQFVDDMFTSPDGRMVYVSRPSLKDVVGIDLATQKIKWRVPVEGYRSDHMAISPDGSKLLVSASTAGKVHVIDPRVGRIVGEFPSGDSPHESNFSADGQRIFHASIGTVYTPIDHPAGDTSKGDRVFEVVDANTMQVVKKLDIGKILEANGYPGYSSAVRPMAIAPDEKTFYFQLSFFHGFVEFDLEKEKPLRIANLPISAETQKLNREEYLLDSAHHGLAINGAGTKLCVAGTMSDYAAIVDRETFRFKQLDVGRKPYWATNSADGKRCWVSSSGDDRVVVLDYATEQEVARIPVGDHPQRVRTGVIRNELVPGLPPAVGTRPALVRRCLGGGRARVEVRDPDNLVATVTFRSGSRQLGRADTRRPFRTTLTRAQVARMRKVSATVRRADGGVLKLSRMLPSCGVRRR